MSFEFTLSPWIQRALAILLALIPVAIVVLMVVSYASDVALQRERVTLLKRERANYAALAQQAPAWNKEVARLEAMAAGNFVFTNRKIDASASQLQSQASDIVKGEGGSDLQSRAEIAAGGEDGPIEIRSSLSFAADISQLTHILYRLRQARPLLLPVHLALRSSASGPLTAPNRLQVELTVAGYARVP